MSAAGSLLRPALRQVWVPVVLGLALLAASGVSGAAAPPPPGDGPGSVPPRFGHGPGEATRVSERLGPELAGERSRSSRTFVGAGGQRVTELSAGSVNFRRGGGWVPIDSRLVAGPDGSVVNAANRYSVRLPAGLDRGPARVAVGDAWAEFSLRGARGERSVDGATASYAGALPGVEARYTALADSVKEELVLADRQATSRFAFDLAVAPGMTLRQDGQRIEALDADGEVVFVVMAPFAVDAADDFGRVTQRLSRAGQGYLLDVAVDEEWLAAPDRQFPVTVDPTWQFSWTHAPGEAGAAYDCTIESDPATQGPCSFSRLYAGLAHGAVKHRPVLSFDVENAVPDGAEVLDAEMDLYAGASTPASSLDLSVHRLTAGFDDDANWTDRTATATWTSPGGDFDAAQAGFGDDVSSPGHATFTIVDLVQNWVDGDQPNHGVLVKSAETGSDHYIDFASSEWSDPDERPTLRVTWEPRVGQRRQWTMVGQQLWDRAGLQVNVANGNLMMSQQDLQVAGTGLSLDVTRFYNNQSTHYYDSGRGWSLNYGAAVGIQRFYQGSTVEGAVMTGPSGFSVRFDRLANGTYVTPSGLDATLVENTGGTFTLTFDQTMEKLHFDAQGWLTAREDRNGNSIDYDIDSDGELASITDTQGRQVTLSHNPDSQVTAMEDSAGRDYSYDVSNGLLFGYTDPDNQTTSYDYDGALNLVEIVDPRGNKTLLDYDNQKRVTEIIRVTNPTAGTGPTWTFTYNAGNTVVEDPRGNDTTFHYDSDLRVTKTVDALGHEAETSYTANSDPATVTAEGAAQTSFGYDSLNNLTSMDQPAGEESGYGYTSSSFPRFRTQGTNPQGTITNYSYNSQGNLATVNDGQSPVQVEARLEYNGQTGGTCTNDPNTKPGTLRCAVDGNGNQTDYGYDTQGNLTSITPELPLGATTLTHDSLSRLKTITDGKAQTRTYTYDPLDRVTQISYSNGATIDYDYDPNGNLIERDDSVHGISSYDYDELNRRTDDTLPSGTTSYGWDAASNLSSLTDPGGTTSYRYDAANRLQDLAEPGGSCTGTVSLCTSFGYSDRDQRTTTAYPNGVTQTVTYDASDKPTRVQAVKAGAPPTTLTDFTYVFDEASPGTRKTYLRQSVTDKNGNTTRYGYDWLDRLTSAVERNSSQTVIDNRSWIYDAASNRTSQTINGTTTSYAYDAANQLCWDYTGSSTNPCGSAPTGATTYSYDANGNTTASSAGAAFAYNIKEQTTSWTPAGGGGATSFAYAGPNQNERTSAAGATQHNTMLGLTREGTTSWVRDPGGTLISQKAGSNRHYYLTDNQGSVVGLADNAGSLAQSYKYDPNGLIRTSTGSVTNPWQYVGAYRHTNGAGGLYKMGARYYQPGLGRWTQQDPIDQAGDLREANRYVYAAADPINLVDPRGTDIFSDVVDVARKAGEGAVDFVKKNKDKLLKGGAKAAAPACYTYKALRDKDSSLRDEIRDLNDCFNPFAWFGE